MIIELKNRKKEPTGSGPAFCMQCKHEWVAVVPTGTVNLECPNCWAMKGLLKYEYNLNEGDFIWTCKCGNTLFYISDKGTMCPNCGTYQQF